MKTSQQPTSQSGADEWTCSLEAFRASLSVMPGDDVARKMTATSGRQCIAPSTKSSPLGLWLRTLLESSRWSSRARFLRWQVQPLFSTRLTTFEDDSNCERPLPFNASALTLKVTDMPSSRCLFRLVPSEPPHRRDRVFIVARRITADTDSAGRRERRCEESQRQNDRHDAQVFDIAEGQGSSGTTPDTSEPRAEGMRQERQDQIHRPQSIADTDGWRGFEVEESVRPKLANGYGLECACGQRPTAYAKCAGLERQDESRSEESGERLHIRRDPAGCSGEDGIGGCCRWMWLEDGSWLPTQSPIHRGNDGLPFDVDRLTLSFGKWRTEALKAYGNAIVPQVMYEIFRAIEQVETPLKRKVKWQK